MRNKLASVLRFSMNFPDINLQRPKRLNSWLLYLTTWVMITFLVLLFVNTKGDRRTSNMETTWHRTLSSATTFNSTGGTFKQYQKALNKLKMASIHQRQSDAARSSKIHLSTLPVKFLMEHGNFKRTSKWCANLPELFHIKMNNIYWQHVQLNEGKNNIYFYAAYYDIRGALQNKRKRAVVRLLAMTDLSYKSQHKSLCQFWFEDQKAPQFSAKATFDYIWNITWGFDHDNFLLPVLVSCPITTESRQAPSVVSFVENHCDNATVALRVQHAELFEGYVKLRKEKPVNFSSVAVCVKGLTFLEKDKSVRLIEWLELLKLLGAQKVFMYDLSLHPKTRNTLQHYQKSGFVDLTTLTLPGDQFNTPELITMYFTEKITSKRLNEVIPYNDCLYRNLYRYDYIALLDIDEVILPKRSDVLTWKNMLEDVAANLTNPKIGVMVSNISNYASICARNVYFFDNFSSDPLDEIPSYLHMLNHVTRAYNYTKPGRYVKCFHSVNRALILHNHFPLRCLSKCRFRSIDLSLAHMQHYRDGCTADLQSHCQDYLDGNISDTTIWKYKDKLVQNANHVLQELGYING